MFRRKLFRTEPMLVHDAGAVALAEYIYIPNKFLDRRHVFGLVEVQETAPLSMARIHDMLRHLRQMLGRDHQYVGAIFGQGARRDRPGEYARQIEYLDS